MASQRLKRKALRNRVRVKVRNQRIKDLLTKPVIKTVDVEKIKEEFAAAKKAASKKGGT